jgi:hypothetical protein
VEGGVGDAGGDAGGAVFGGGVLVCGGALISRGFLAGGFAGARGSWARRIWRAGDDPKYRGNARGFGGAGVGDHGDEIRFRAAAAGSAQGKTVSASRLGKSRDNC